MRKLFCIIKESYIPQCPEGSIVEVELSSEFSFDDFIQHPSGFHVKVKFGNETFLIQKMQLKDFWIA